MRKIILIIYLIIISCSPGLKYLDKFDGLKGQPSKVELKTYKVTINDSLDKPIELLSYKISEIYDTKGRKLKTLMFGDNDTIIAATTRYSYDKSGNLLYSIMYNRDSTTKIETWHKYDVKGRKIGTSYERGDIKISRKFFFDEENRTETIIAEYEDGSFKEHSIQKHDENWKKVELLSLDSLGNQTMRIEFGYDKNENINNSKWYNGEDELYSFYNTSFNDYHDPILKLKYKVNGKDTTLNKTTRFKYDNYKNIKEKKLISDEKLVFISRYNYEYN